MRYARQEILKQIGLGGQRKLASSKAVVVGCGATGSVAAELLVRAGVSVRIIDRDFVEPSNLQRQTLFNEDDVGKAKALVAHQRLARVNSDVEVEGFIDDVTSVNIGRLVGKPSVVLDCTDNMETRFLINDYCLRERIPWVYCGAIGTGGLVAAFGPCGKPCLRCMIPSEPAGLETCDTVGVLNAAANAVASLQVVQALKILLGDAFGEELFDIDVWSGKTESTKINQREGCPACRGVYEYLQKAPRVTALCGRGAYQIRLEHPPSLKEVHERASKTMKTELFEGVLHLYPDGKRITLFGNARAIVEAQSESEARARLAKFVGV